MMTEVTEYQQPRQLRGLTQKAFQYQFQVLNDEDLTKGTLFWNAYGALLSLNYASGTQQFWSLSKSAAHDLVLDLKRF